MFTTRTKWLARCGWLAMCVSTAAIAAVDEQPLPAPAAIELSADEIVRRAAEVTGGNDAVAHLDFTFSQPGQMPRRLGYTMAWKRYEGENGLDSKVLFFSDFPPDDKGKAYLGWIYAPQSGKAHDQWMYLPELRMVRKMTHVHHDHAHQDDDFGRSVLKHEDLMPRPPQVDQHSLYGEGEGDDGTKYYIIQSVPREKDENFPYSKVLRWISKDNFLTGRLDYFDPRGSEIKHQHITWQRVGDQWMWQRVVGTELKTHAETVLEVSRARVDLGLPDSLFTTRKLPLGVSVLD